MLINSMALTFHWANGLHFSVVINIYGFYGSTVLARLPLVANQAHCHCISKIKTWILSIIECFKKVRDRLSSIEMPFLGLKVLLRRLRLRLERDSRSGDLIDQSGRYLKMEPLTTVKDLKKHLLKVVSILQDKICLRVCFIAALIWISTLR